MDPTTMEMVIPAIKVRGRKGQPVPILPDQPSVTVQPAKAIKKNMMPNAKKLQKISMESAPETIPGDRIYDEGEKMAKVRAARKTPKAPKAKAELVVDVQENRVMEEAHHLKEGEVGLRHDKEAMKKHIAGLRADHKKMLAMDIAKYRYEMRMMKKK